MHSAMKRLLVGFAVPLLLLSTGCATTGNRMDFTVKAHLAQPPQVLFATLTDFPNWPSWYEPAKSMEAVEFEGRPAWRMELSSGPIINEVVESRPPEAGQPAKLVTRVADPKSPVQGGWELTITESNGGSDLTVIDRAQIDNPLFRLLLWSILGVPEKTLVPVVVGLARKFGEEVTPTMSEGPPAPEAEQAGPTPLTQAR
jgi:hypothetical protein